jgi:geranylgeranyl diphosphate synthase, type I
MTQGMFAGLIDDRLERALDAAMRGAVEEISAASPLLAGMGMYHMGWVDRDFAPVDPATIDRGKRIRPAVALLSAMAAGGRADAALHIAASIELLHNFTLVHDDIQDASRLRRHRDTVWAIWGTGQALNAGDALFAASHRLLLRGARDGLTPDTVLALADAFDRMTIDIVGGQTMDLAFEAGHRASERDYLLMIERKTAAILAYAAWAGSLAGGADANRADGFLTFGRAVGLGFQVRDDVLGIWGDVTDTGKTAADDIRRRKQSLPLILLREEIERSEDGSGAFTLRTFETTPEVTEAEVEAVLALLERHAIRERADAYVTQYHDAALRALEDTGCASGEAACNALRSLVELLAGRTR